LEVKLSFTLCQISHVKIYKTILTVTVIANQRRFSAW